MITYSVELTTYSPVKVVGIEIYNKEPGNPHMAIGGSAGWNTCGHYHRTLDAADKCARRIDPLWSGEL
jgi:hypothetical protein